MPSMCGNTQEKNIDQDKGFTMAEKVFWQLLEKLHVVAMSATHQVVHHHPQATPST